MALALHAERAPTPRCSLAYPWRSERVSLSRSRPLPVRGFHDPGRMSRRLRATPACRGLRSRRHDSTWSRPPARPPRWSSARNRSKVRDPTSANRNRSPYRPFPHPVVRATPLIRASPTTGDVASAETFSCHTIGRLGALATAVLARFRLPLGLVPCTARDCATSNGNAQPVPTSERHSRWTRGGLSLRRGSLVLGWSCCRGEARPVRTVSPGPPRVDALQPEERRPA